MFSRCLGIGEVSDEKFVRVAHFVEKIIRPDETDTTVVTHSRYPHSSMNGNYERDEFEFDGSDCQSSFSINVGVYSEEHAIKRRTSATRRVSDKIGMMSMLYQRSVGKFRDPYKLCKKREINDYRSEWYQRSKRSIPFKVLETSATDAILAMDRTGSYMFAVGDGRKSYSAFPSKDLTLFPAISLRLYGESLYILGYEIGKL